MCEHTFSVLLGIYVGVELLGHMITSFLRNCLTVFQSDSTILCYLQQCMRVPVSPHPCQHLFFFLIIAILWMWSNISLWLWFVFTSVIEHVFMWLLAVCIHSLDKCLFRSYVHVLVGLSFSLRISDSSVEEKTHQSFSFKPFLLADLYEIIWL